MEKIRAERAPQVLKIDHDDTISLSGESEVDSEDEFLSLNEEEKISKRLTDDSTSNDIILDFFFFSSSFLFFLFFSDTHILCWSCTNSNFEADISV